MLLLCDLMASICHLLLAYFEPSQPKTRILQKKAFFALKKTDETG